MRRREPALWAKVYVVMEAVYHLPLSIWVIGALIKELSDFNEHERELTPQPDNAMVPVHLLVWAVQTTITTLTCLADVWGWTDRTFEQKRQLTALYGPYILFGE
ncbi:hypothetical protein KEM56_004095 [Ascosphaera pollenicola]|nr:hypothetical protein KEM56_004095 [Ascosphaera pollenicola]